MSGGDHPYIKVEHECVDNREVTSAVARGVKDYRPQLERISPNIEHGNFLSRKVIEEVLSAESVAILLRFVSAF